MGSIIGKFISAWTRPMGAFNDMKTEGENASIKPSILFVVAMGVLSGVITAIIGTIRPTPELAGNKAMIWLSVGIVPLVSVIGSFIGAFIIWGLTDGVLRGTTPQYKTSYRLLALLAAFSPVSALLSAIPTIGQWLAIAVNVWATIVMIQGIIIIRETPKVRTWVTCGILFAVLIALGVVARIAAQDQLRNPTGLSDLGDFSDLSDDDINGNQARLDETLENLANKAKAEEAESATK